MDNDLSGQILSLFGVVVFIVFVGIVVWAIWEPISEASKKQKVFVSDHIEQGQLNLIAELMKQGKHDHARIQRSAPKDKNGNYLHWGVNVGESVEEGKWMQKTKNGAWVEFHP